MRGPDRRAVRRSSFCGLAGDFVLCFSGGDFQPDFAVGEVEIGSMCGDVAQFQRAGVEAEQVWWELCFDGAEEKGDADTAGPEAVLEGVAAGDFGRIDEGVRKLDRKSAWVVFTAKTSNRPSGIPCLGRCRSRACGRP